MSDRTKPGIAAAAGSNPDEADLGDLAVECVGDALLQLAISATPSGSEDDAVWRGREASVIALAIATSQPRILPAQSP